jgi:hypothetical protein
MRREADAKLEALWTLAMRVWDLVLGSADGPSSLETSLSVVAELLEGWTDAVDAHRAHWGSCPALVAIVSHFSELEANLEVFGSGCSTDLT